MGKNISTLLLRRKIFCSTSPGRCLCPAPAGSEKLQRCCRGLPEQLQWWGWSQSGLALLPHPGDHYTTTGSTTLLHHTTHRYPNKARRVPTVAKESQPWNNQTVQVYSFNSFWLADELKPTMGHKMWDRQTNWITNGSKYLRCFRNEKNMKIFQ